MPYYDVISIILGGGRGTRLHPLTEMRAKPAVPLAGKYRLIDIPISNCINSGITGIYVLTQFLSASLHRHVYETYKFDVFSRRFIELLPAEQTLTENNWYQGTADAVRRQLSEIRNQEIVDALILPGDHLYRMNFGDMIEEHRKNNADVTISVIPVSPKDAPRFGILKTTAHNKIVDYCEKPGDSGIWHRLINSSDTEKPLLASMGIYIFRMNVLERILQEHPGQDFGGDIIPYVIQKCRVFAFRFSGYWEDIGTIRSFYEANISLTDPHPAFDFYDPFHPIFTRARYLPPSRIDGCEINESVICDGCRIYNSQIQKSVIGLRSMIQPHCRLTRVVMMGADYYEVASEKAKNLQDRIPHMGVGNNSSIEGAIIDKNARIGKDVVIRSHQNDPDRKGDGYYIRDGLVVIPKNAVISDGTMI